LQLSRGHGKLSNLIFVKMHAILIFIISTRYDYHRKTEFNGKIGIWPFTTVGVALRSSNHRPKGATVIKPVESISKAVYKVYLLEHVIPAIKAQWPRGEKASQSGYSKIMLRHISSRMIETSLKLDGVVAGIFGCSTSHQTHLTSMFLT
jgi:hypothetical protein